MLGIGNLFFLIGGVIFYTLAVIMFLDQRKSGLTNDLYLGLYFISCGALTPFLGFIPFIEENAQIIFVILEISNLSIPIVHLSISLYLDYSIYEKKSTFSMLLAIVVGLILGLFISDILMRLSWMTTPIGLFPIISYITIPSQIALYAALTLHLVVFLRFLNIGLKTIRKNINVENATRMKKFVWIMFIGPIIWLIMNLMKRMVPAFYGTDFILFSLFYLMLIPVYRKSRELFYFLPGTLERVILIYKNGVGLFDYSFKERKIERAMGDEREVGEYHLLRNLFYATTTVLDDTFQKQVQSDEGLQNIQFGKSQIIYHASSNIRWLLVARSNHSSYYKLLVKIADFIEANFKEEIKKIETGIMELGKIEKAAEEQFAKLM